MVTDPHKLVRQALSDHLLAQNQYRGPDQALWSYSRRAAETLNEWHAPVPSTVAVLLAPALKFSLLPVGALESSYGSNVVQLTSKLVKWSDGVEELSRGSKEISNVDATMEQRLLYREAYRELPQLTFVLSALAFQGARLSALAKSMQLSKGLASYTENVLVPLTQMLGLWSLRREMLDMSTRVLSPARFEELESAYNLVADTIGKKEVYTRTGFDEIVRVHQARTAKENPIDTRVVDKAMGFVCLTKLLNMLFKDAGIKPRPRIYPIRPFPGLTLNRIKGGESEQDLVSRLSIRIYCRSVDDCYRVLGIVHGVGKPIATKFTERANDYISSRFNDFIATPLPNGYRAIHTAIMLELEDASANELVTEFRILTPRMHRLNEFGAIDALHRYPARYKNISARWKLAENGGSGNGYRLDAETQRIVQQHELGTRSDGKFLYVFSPHGEVRAILNGSTALDFAYNIHSDLANQTDKIEINGRSVQFNQQLNNGDLIRIHYDPHSPGPDISWLGHVATARARGNLRRALNKRARSIHVGRERLQAALDKRLQFYRREKSFDLTINSLQLDAFLWVTARAKGFHTLDELYNKLVKGRPSPDQMVRQLISYELATGVMRANELSLGLRRSQILFCDDCRPVPGDRIEGVKRRCGNMTVHRQGSGDCSGSRKTKEKTIPLKWADTTSFFKGESVVFYITATDRHGLLSNLLEKVYNQDEAYLHKVDAEVYGDGNANISLVVTADSKDTLASVQDKIESINDVTRLNALPPSPDQLVKLNNPPREIQSSPYSVVSVHDHRFYDRRTLIKQILEWLADTSRKDYGLMRGQKRVGKTSLALHLQRVAIPLHQRGFCPVYIDLLSLSAPFDAKNLVKQLIESIVDEIRTQLGRKGETLVVPPQEDDSPVQWLKRFLAHITTQLHGRQLLVILDEFSVLCQHQSDGLMDGSVFSNLRSLMSQQANVRWLLIVQDACFTDETTWGDADQIFGRTKQFKVSPLDPAWAKKLVTEPMSRNRIRYADEEKLAAKFVSYTGGNPYFINCLGNKIYDEVTRIYAENQEDQRIVTEKMLYSAAAEFVSLGFLHFAHFIEHMVGAKEVVLALLATFDKRGVEMSTFLEAASDQAPNLSETGLNKALKSLEELGIIEMNAERNYLVIPVELFHQWLQTNRTFAEVITKWPTPT